MTKTVIVNRSISIQEFLDATKLEQLIKAVKLDYVNSDITSEHFPIKGTPAGISEMKLLHINRIISTKDVLKNIEEKGYRPATIYELLVFAEKKWNGKALVVALGSVWWHRNGRRFVACLDRDGGKRLLYLSWFEGDWRAIYRFLVVPISSGAGTLEPLPPELEINGVKYKKIN